MQPSSDHFDGERFFNPGRRAKNTLWQVLKWQLQGERAKWPRWIDDRARADIANMPGPEEATVTLVNHATLLVQFQKFSVLTDPVFSQRVSPFSRLGPRRVRAPGLSIEELPRVDIVVISHNHYDHLDLSSLRALVSRFPNLLVVVPLGNARYLKSLAQVPIVELDWWQSVPSEWLAKFGASDAAITLVPAQHWSRRTLRDTNRALWGGYALRSGHVNVYFAGDTGYGPHFKKIQERVGPIDLSLLPIGAYKPRWFMQEHHMDPEDAVRAHHDLDSHQSIAMLFGTFLLTVEGIDEPASDLKSALAKLHSTARFFIPRNGESFRYSRRARKNSDSI
jgi:L-ascorbate metabolism protein UlaG (beta-lactamase superfamily)